MQLVRPVHAFRRRQFGRGPVRVAAIAAPANEPLLSDDIKLFAATFLSGFLFVSILIG